MTNQRYLSLSSDEDNILSMSFEFLAMCDSGVNALNDEEVSLSSGEGVFRMRKTKGNSSETMTNS